MPDISSLQNERVKHVVKLREDRRQRHREGLTLVEGRYELELALGAGLRPVEIFHSNDYSGDIPDVLRDLQLTNVNLTVFKKMSLRESPDGWLGIFPRLQRTLDSLTLQSNPLIILAESIEKPGNLGAMLRTADTAHVDGFLVSEPRVDLDHPGVIRASRGTVFTVPVAVTTNDEALTWLRERKILLLAATPAADVLYSAVDLRLPVCVAVGTEDLGLSDYWLEKADLKVRIPMLGKVNSLNVSTSTAIILYEAIRQRLGDQG
jgi:TrmH family RNA methyltransferase